MDPEIESLLGTKLGNFRLERVLGRGRMGIVFLAKDEALLRSTAVKVMSWSFQGPTGHDPEAWFLAEARNVARISHPGVVQIYGVARHGPHCYIAMEYVEGESADRVVAAKGPLGVAEATKVLLQIVGALQVAHHAGLVHRDIKPANLLLRADGTAKLGDFGMALHRDASQSNLGVVQAGTPQFLAPELWGGGRAASPAADIYALGVTYFFLLTGRLPFEAPDLPGLAQAHASVPVPDPSMHVPMRASRCGEVIRRCMAKGPQDRYESASALGLDLRGILQDLEIGSVPPPSRAPADESWVRFFGLRRRPFQLRGLEELPLEGVDLRPFGQALAGRLQAQPGMTLLLTGGPMGGGQGLVLQALRAMEGLGLLAGLRPEPTPAEGLLHRACLAFGAVPLPGGGPHAALEGLLGYLESGAPGSRPAVLVLSMEQNSRDLVTLMQVARNTRYLSLVVLGDPADAANLRMSGLDDPGMLAFPTLTFREVQAYLQGWIKATQEAGTAPLVLTPDASLMLANRSEGRIPTLDLLATNMLQVAAAERRRVISSWDAWVAPGLDPDLFALDLAQGKVPPRPESWPTPEVLQILNTCRQQAGTSQRTSET